MNGFFNLVLVSFFIAQIGSAVGASPDSQSSNGVSWPAGQALPHFATPAAELDAIEVQALTRDEQITFSALQGQVNRKQPRILLVDSRTDEGALTWVNTLNLKIATNYNRQSKYALLARYAAEIEGAVIYDPSISPHYRNLAGTIAGLRKAIPVTSAILEQAREHGIHLSTLIDLRNLTNSSPVAIYEHLFTNYWNQCSKRLILSARPTDRGGDMHHTRDLAAAVGAAVIWLDARVSAEKDLLRKFYGSMTAGDSVILGWHATERSGITTASEFGIGTVPSDFYLNGSVYAGHNHRIEIPPVPKMPNLENKAYITLFISDGDNIQYTQRAMRRIWDRSEDIRGKLPLNWTIASALTDVGPGLLNYYYRTATSNDCFVSGPSGMGYLMPFNTLNEPGAPVGLYLADSQRMDSYARRTESYLQRAGLRVVTIWDDATSMQRASYEKYCRNLYGATVQNFKDVRSVAGSVVNNRVRFDKLVIPYASTYEHLHGSVVRQIEGWDKKSPLFLSYQASIWSKLKPAKLLQLTEDISNRFSNQVAFVRADHYFNLYNQAHKIPYNLSMLPHIKVKSSQKNSRPELVLDGTPSTFWNASEAASLELDLGNNYRISRYRLRYNGNFASHTLAASSDGKEWTTLDKQTEISKSVADVDFEQVQARYLKLLVNNPTSSLVQIGELEIYGY